MNIRELTSIIAKKEGGKREVHISDIREIIRILGDEIGENKEWLDVLYEYACYRMRHKKHGK